MQAKVAAIIRKDPAIQYLNSTIGPGGPSATANIGRIFVALKPRNEREGVNTVIDRLRAAAGNAVPGLVVRFRAVQNLNISGRPSQGEYQYTLTSSDTDTLYRVAPEIQAKIAELGIVRDVATDLDLRNPQMNIEIDREKAGVYGISIDQVRQELFNAFGSRQVATIYTPDDDYQVILESKPEFQTDISALSRIYLKTASGQAVPLEAVTRLTSTVGPLQVNHQGNQPSVTISFNLTPGASLGQAVDAIQEIERDARLPATVASSFQGSAQVFQDSLKGQWILVLAAIFAAYVLLGILYESFIHPITIISGLPSAGIGALITLMAFKMDLSVIAMIGIVMLVGIVKKNAIMMIDFAHRAAKGRAQRRGRDPRGGAVAVPADHDDHVRGDLRRAADRARARRRRGAAPAARRLGGGRARAVAAAHALHHAGGLHLSRPHRPDAEAPARAAARGGSRARRASEGHSGGVGLKRFHARGLTPRQPLRLPEYV